MKNFIFYLKFCKNLFFLKIEFEFFYLFYFFWNRKTFFKKKYAVDIGSNYGIYSFLFSKFFKKVESFEPIQKHFIETKNLFSNVTVHNYALGNKDSSEIINVPMINNKLIYGYSSIHTKFKKSISEKIYVKKFDKVFKYKTLSFMKIDVEGYEIQVIKGAFNLIKKFRPIIMIEIEDRHNNKSFEFIYNQLKNINYSCYYLNKFKLKEITSSSVALDQLSNTRYINNFFFITK
jgi:FkbM family methyltransferase